MSKIVLLPYGRGGVPWQTQYYTAANVPPAILGLGDDWAYVGTGERRQPWVGLAAALALVVGTVVVFGAAAVRRDRAARRAAA